MTNINIKDRIKLYKHYNNLITNVEDKNAFFTKEDVLGEGNQGKVYKYCKKKKCANSEIAVKKMYLDYKEGKYTEDMYNAKALRYGIYIELASNQLINELILQRVSPNFILHYTHNFQERDSVCSETYPYKSYFYNEFINNAESYTEWASHTNSMHLWYNALFQITSAIYVLQKYFNMTHLDLHSENILVRKISKGGYWTYKINDKEYKVPNLGYQFYISDFGHAWIPNNFKSWFISQRYKKKRIHKGFDMYQLFKSTMPFTTSPPQFRKDVKYVINKLRNNNNFEDIIDKIWGDRYDISNKKTTSKELDVFDMTKELKIGNIPEELKHLILY